MTVNEQRSQCVCVCRSCINRVMKCFGTLPRARCCSETHKPLFYSSIAVWNIFVKCCTIYAVIYSVHSSFALSLWHSLYLGNSDSVNNYETPPSIQSTNNGEKSKRTSKNTIDGRRGWTMDWQTRRKKNMWIWKGNKVQKSSQTNGENVEERERKNKSENIKAGLRIRMRTALWHTCPRPQQLVNNVRGAKITRQKFSRLAD